MKDRVHAVGAGVGVARLAPLPALGRGQNPSSGLPWTTPRLRSGLALPTTTLREGRASGAGAFCLGHKVLCPYVRTRACGGRSGWVR